MGRPKSFPTAPRLFKNPFARGGREQKPKKWRETLSAKGSKIPKGQKRGKILESGDVFDFPERFPETFFISFSGRITSYGLADLHVGFPNTLQMGSFI
jgi:hypothetical protein